MPSFYQDRLGTNIGKFQKRCAVATASDFFFVAVGLGRITVIKGI